MKNFVVNSAVGIFCCNYANDLCIYDNYASDNVCCIFAGFQVLLSVAGMLVDLSVAIMQVTVSVAVMQLEVSAAHMQVTVSAANMWVTVFIVIMQMGVSVTIMQVVFSAVHYAHDPIVIMQMTSSLAMQVTVSSNNFLFLSLSDNLFS